MGKENEITRRMLAKLRSRRDESSRLVEEELGKATIKESDNFVTRSRILMEEAVRKINEEADGGGMGVSVKITKETPDFGDVKSSQEDMVKKAVGENIKFDDEALVFFPEADDLTLNGSIPSLGIRFQFRYNEPSGDGVFVWAEALQLSEANFRIVGKLRDAFLNWKDGITSDGELLDKLKKAYEGDKL